MALLFVDMQDFKMEDDVMFQQFSSRIFANLRGFSCCLVDFEVDLRGF